MKHPPTVHESSWPEIRNALIAFFWQRRPHVIHGTTEVDVTDSLQTIRRLEKELRIAISFHAFVVYCVVQAAMQHPVIHTYRYGKKLLNFADIDLLSPLNKHLPGGVHIPVGHIIRSAQSKTLAQINWELRQAVRAEDLTDDEAVAARRRLGHYPSWGRRIASWYIKRNPYWLKRINGTMLVTNVQTRGAHNALFAIADTVHTTSVAIGNITNRLQLDREGKVVSRKMLCLAGSADHDIVDGMGLARFAHMVSHLLESGAGLDEFFVEESRKLMEEANYGQHAVAINS